jgi:hypothetical protein
MSLWELNSLARVAHYDCHGSQQMLKLAELKASAGEPRTICVGTSFSFDLPLWAAEKLVKPEESTVKSGAPGCFRIFRDTTHAAGGGNYWSMWCPEHAPDTGQRLRQWRNLIRNRWLDYAHQVRARPS